MQQETTADRQMISGEGRLQAAVRRGGGVGVLAVVLLLPLTAAGQDTSEAFVSSDRAEAVEALAVTAAREGDLDTSFGGDGKVITNFGDSSQASAVAIQPDGKIVVAGEVWVQGVRDIGLVRYLPDGTLDRTFGDFGRVITDFSHGVNAVSALVLQPDGKIVVAGTAVFNRSDAFALARYLPDGTRDLTFGSNGTVITDFGAMTGPLLWPSNRTARLSWPDIPRARSLVLSSLISPWHAIPPRESWTLLSATPVKCAPILATMTRPWLSLCSLTARLSLLELPLPVVVVTVLTWLWHATYLMAGWIRPSVAMAR